MASKYLDSANQAADPSAYVESIFDLIKEVPKKARLIVNTNGWVEGLGAEQIQAIIQKFDRATTQIVHLSSNKSSELDISGRWVTAIKGELSSCSAFQKGATSRNRRIWDYLCAKPEWLCLKPG